MVIDTEIIAQRLKMLQEIGLPLITWAIKHTLVVVLLLRLSGIIDNGIAKNGRFHMELKAYLAGQIGNYKIRLWTVPVYSDCSRWSLRVVRVV